MEEVLTEGEMEEVTEESLYVPECNESLDITYPKHHDFYKHANRTDGFHYSFNEEPELEFNSDILTFQFWRPYNATLNNDPLSSLSIYLDEDKRDKSAEDLERDKLRKKEKIETNKVDCAYDWYPEECWLQNNITNCMIDGY